MRAVRFISDSSTAVHLKTAVGLRILEFFLERLDENLFIHFEVIPDHLPDKLKAAIARFPAGKLQFEIGIQTWNPQVQALISRRQDNARAEENLRWLRDESQALLHVDLIAGLPGEDLESFGRGFVVSTHSATRSSWGYSNAFFAGADRTPHRRQAMRYSADAYAVLQTSRIGFRGTCSASRGLHGIGKWWRTRAASARGRRNAGGPAVMRTSCASPTGSCENREDADLARSPGRVRSRVLVARWDCAGSSPVRRAAGRLRGVRLTAPGRLSFMPRPPRVVADESKIRAATGTSLQPQTTNVVGENDMADITADRAMVEPQQNLVTLTHVMYALHAFSAVMGILTPALIVTSFLFGWPSIIAVIINYVKRDEVRGTYLESHFQWQLRTFWYSLLWLVVASSVAITLIGLPGGPRRGATVSG